MSTRAHPDSRLLDKKWLRPLRITAFAFVLATVAAISFGHPGWTAAVERAGTGGSKDFGAAASAPSGKQIFQASPYGDQGQGSRSAAERFNSLAAGIKDAGSGTAGGGAANDGPPISPSTLPPQLPSAGDSLQSCQAVQLSGLSGRIRIDEAWGPGCGPAGEYGATSRQLRFSLNEWAFVRMELVSLDDVSIRLALVEGQADQPIRPGADRVLAGGPNVPEGHTFAWRQDVLQPGSYRADLLSHEPDNPGRFVFTIHAQPIPPPPLKFTSVSVGYLRSCGLIEGGAPLCWGLGIRGADLAAARAPFEEISVGTSNLVCGRKPDGSAICWGGPGLSTRNPASGQKLVQIDVGDRYMCGVQDDGQALCWGSRRYAIPSAAPGDVPSGHTFSQISVARDYTCGLTTDGIPVCWGDDWVSASAAPADERLVSIAAGERHSCGMRSDGTMACWGSSGMDACFAGADGFNECGGVRGSGISPLPPERESLVQLSSGEPHCGLRADGLPVCWTPFASLGLVPPPIQEFESISATATLACGLAEDGTLTCWGDDRFGQASPPTGRNATGEIRWPQPQNVFGISAGTSHVCAIDAGGEISCWGPNWWNGRFPGDESFAAVSSGFGHSCALTRSGQVICRGDDWLGQSSPPPGLVLNSISVGTYHSCGLRRDGSAVCWGAEDPDGSPPPENVRFRSLDVGSRHACGITRGGEAVCWGRGADIQVLPAAESDGLVAVSAGGIHTCYLFETGSIRCLGNNEFGVTDAPPEPGFAAVSAGGYLSCGLRNDGSAVCWGAEFLGPIDPPRGKSFASVSAGQRFACGVLTDGTVNCWGDMSDGQDMPVRYVSPGKSPQKFG